MAFGLNHRHLFAGRKGELWAARICIFASYSFINVPDVPSRTKIKAEKKKKPPGGGGRRKKKDERDENESGRSFSDPDFRFATITTR